MINEANPKSWYSRIKSIIGDKINCICLPPLNLGCNINIHLTTITKLPSPLSATDSVYQHVQCIYK